MYDQIEYVKFNDVFDVTRYPAGEIHVESSVPATNPGLRRFIEVSDCRTVEDLFAVAMAARIRDGSTDTYFIPHMPFARHDHRRHRGDGYPIEVVQHLLEGVDILTVDPHSDVTGNLWPHITQAEIIRYTQPHGQTFVIPDTGATKKAFSWLRPQDNFIQCLKHRDRNTGKLSGFQVLDSELTVRSEDPLMIVDDICDGGGTFLGIAEELRSHGWHGPLTLFVTHGLFQPDKFEALAETFDAVITYGTPTVEHDKLFTIPWESLFWHCAGISDQIQTQSKEEMK